jgi:ATP-dependent protease ClpP protease subunit
MPTPNKDYRENPSRCVHILGKINQEMLHTLTPQINLLRASSRDAITAYIDSAGGYSVAAEAIRCLITSPSQDGAKCRLIAVVTGTAASAAADLVALADYSIAYPHAEIICHGSKHLWDEELTYEYASLLAADLHDTNERIALRLARHSFPRIIWRLTQLGDPFNHFREETTELGHLIGTLAEKFKAENKGLLKEALEKQKIISVLTNCVRTHFRRFKNPGAMSKCQVQGEILKAIINHKMKVHDGDGWSVDSQGLQDISNDFTLVDDFYYGSQTKDLESFNIYGRLLLKPTETTELRSKTEEQQKQFVIERASLKLKRIWYFAVSLCRLLQSKDYKLTPEEAYWMGVVDEVPGSGLPNDRESIESLEAKVATQTSSSGEVAATS